MNFLDCFNCPVNCFCKYSDFNLYFRFFTDLSFISNIRIAAFKRTPVSRSLHLMTYRNHSSRYVRHLLPGGFSGEPEDVFPGWKFLICSIWNPWCVPFFLLCIFMMIPGSNGQKADAFIIYYNSFSCKFYRNFQLVNQFLLIF